jgi:hypothetical protein
MRPAAVSTLRLRGEPSSEDRYSLFKTANARMVARNHWSSHADLNKAEVGVLLDTRAPAAQGRRWCAVCSDLEVTHVVEIGDQPRPSRVPSQPFLRLRA